MIRRSVLLALMLMCGWGSLAEAANPFSRVKFFTARRGGPEIVGNGYISAADTPDYLVFFLVGSGPATLTVFDADTPGDTIAVNGTLNAIQRDDFSAAATSPAQVVETVLVPIVAILVVDVSYTSLINATPAQYIYKLSF